MDFRLDNGTSSKWCSQYVNIDGGSDDSDYEMTKKILYCIEHVSGQWVISMDDLEDWSASGYQPVYKSTKNVQCPTEIDYKEWEKTLHNTSGWGKSQPPLFTREKLDIFDPIYCFQQVFWLNIRPSMERYKQFLYFL